MNYGVLIVIIQQNSAHCLLRSVDNVDGSFPPELSRIVCRQHLKVHSPSMFFVILQERDDDEGVFMIFFARLISFFQFLFHKGFHHEM